MSKDRLLVLRRIHGKLHEKRIQLQQHYSFWKYIRFPLGEKTLIVGVPEYDNLGDSAIAISQELFLKKLGFPSCSIKSITSREYYLCRKFIRRSCDKKTLITSIGGGNMGNQWFNEEELRWNVLKDFFKVGVTIFPQTIYYTTTADGQNKQQESITIYNHSNIKLVAREQKSYEIMKGLYPKAKILLTPDIVLSTNMNDYGVHCKNRSNILWVMRSDAEKNVTDEECKQLLDAVGKHDFSIVKTDMYSNVQITKQNRLECVQNKMNEFCEAKLVITDRLHGMIFAAITETPCIVFSNYNHKVKGTYDWISYLSYIKYVDNVESAIALIPELLNMKNCHFDNTPLLPYFDRLKAFILDTDY